MTVILQRIARSGMVRLRSRPLWMLWAGGVILCLGVLAGSSWFALHERQEAISERGLHLRNISAMVADSTARNFQSLDHAMERLAMRMREGKVRVEGGAGALPPWMDAVLRDLAASLPPSQAIMLVDQEGWITGHSRGLPATPINLSDRPYFAAARDYRAPDVFLTDVVTSRRYGVPTIYLVRRLLGEDGRFAGLVLGAIEIRQAEDLFGSARLGHGQALGLWRRDGVLIAHLPLRPGALGRVEEAGTVERLAAADGGTVILPGREGEVQAAPVSLPEYGLILSASEALDEVLDDWALEAVWIAAGATLTCATTLLVVLLVSRRLRDQERLEKAMAALRVDEERQRAERELAAQHARFVAALGNMSQGLLMFDAEGRLSLANAAMHRLFALSTNRLERGMTPAEIIGAMVREGNLHGESAHFLHAAYMARVAQGLATRYSRRLSDGRFLSIGFTPFEGGWLTEIEDVTERQRADERIAHMASHDSLTGLPNRLALRMRMEEALSRAGQGGPFAVLCLDLDHFKDVNDTMGHLAGDRLLCLVAERLRGLAREEDMIARLGGDEFAILAQPSGSALLLREMAERVVEALSEPFLIEGQPVLIGTSLGIAQAPADGTDAETLMKKADLALYRAKGDGRGRARLFEPAMEQQLVERRRLESELREALLRGQLELFYQPLVQVATRRIIGFEALMRWRHPGRGMVPPGEFIPAAEENGLIVQMGEWALLQACREAARWPDGLRVGVNLSPVQFRSKRLEAAVEAALAASGLEPGRLELEITESSVMHDPEATLALIGRFRAMGVRVAMDDFGTGHSSLAYLRHFPFDKVKLDMAFIREIEQPANLAIVRAVTGIAESMAIGTTAEGVETEAQFATIAREGCAEAQGYLFGAPCPAEAIPALLAGVNGIEAGMATTAA
ncbi:bifunctional diguanylate cyclase/phosphodiesterase [Muricoccus pecuniae]|uniref:Diguanylate cyclase (GGDEF)-like protein n=1 Tax=Muricoccus pecuniae TaxID=693023 RepID=A0A840YC87_9PROT|nr:EAL domain-containing protein [Roseomonas pecuniae]MBB5692152.1 diguanylate cyclase (GGDEF)-like protein [Roseomonas pecuniae]